MSINFVGSLGLAIFQNLGLVCFLCILLPRWYSDDPLNLGDSFTVLAIVYYLFYSINSVTFYSFITFKHVSRIITRVAHIL